MGMTSTRLSTVQADGRWRVEIVWPSGKINYFGNCQSKKEAGEWIAQHHSLTVNGPNDGLERNMCKN
jgi:hypothetical protein